MRGITSSKYDVIVNCVWNNDELRLKLEELMLKNISKQTDTMCAQKASTFKVTDNDSLKSVNHSQQEDELSATAPLLLKCLKAAAYNERTLQKNKIKTKEYIQPAILTAVGILLNCHNKNINLHSTVIAMLLRCGGADKLTVKRLNKLGFSLSYAEALGKQSQISETNEDIVKGWIKKRDPLPPQSSEVTAQPSEVAETKNGQSVSQVCTSTADEMEIAFDECDNISLDDLDKAFREMNI